MSAPVDVLEMHRTKRDQAERPIWLPAVPSRDLGTLEAIQAEKQRELKVLLAQKRDLLREIDRVQGDLWVVEADINDHAEYVRFCEFPDGAA